MFEGAKELSVSPARPDTEVQVPQSLTILVASGEKFTARTLLMAESETVEQPADLDTIYSNSRGWQHALSFSVFSLVSYHLEYTHLCHGHRPLRFLPSIVCPGQQVSIRDERGCAESEQ